MNDRASFLAAIKDDPTDDVRRLAFADWLDDHGESDLDTATAEFIRLGCEMKPQKNRQNIFEGRWLQKNWHRLLPLVSCAGFQLYSRDGRNVLCKRRVKVKTERGNEYLETERLNLTFWRGFVSNASVYNLKNRGALRLVRTNQPLSQLGIEMSINAIYRAPGQREVVVFKYSCGDDVYELVQGFIREYVEPGNPNVRWKVFNSLPSLTDNWQAAYNATSEAICRCIDLRRQNA